MKKICLILCLVLCLCGCSVKEAPSGLSVVAVNFPAYDFARAVLGDKGEISMLLPTGASVHSFEPSPADIMKIEKADVFIFTGGESDTYIKKILSADENADRITINMCEISGIHQEEHEHSHSHEHRDEHVWLSPDNAKAIVMEISRALSKCAPQHREFFNSRSESYCKRIDEVADETRAAVTAAPIKNLVVADRFPFSHLCEYYSLSHTAAFSACDNFADADAKTVASIIDTVREHGLSFVFCCDGGSDSLKNAVCEETGARALTLYSLDSISDEDFKNGNTYIDFMIKNKQALERGLTRDAD